MTQAEKARAYDEAIKRAKEINNEQKAQPFDVMLKVFPELKESEDEKSKKWILEYLYDGLRKSDEQFEGQFKAAIAWLEKQGEQKPAWSEEDERNYEGIRSCIYHCCVPTDAEYLCNWIETQLSK